MRLKIKASSYYSTQRYKDTEEDKEYFTLLEKLSDKTRQIKETDNEKSLIIINLDEMRRDSMGIGQE